MVDIKMKMTGLRDLEKALLALNKEYSGKAAPQAMRPAVKAAMTSVEEDIGASTPVEDGTLKASVKTVIGKPTKKMVSQSAHYNQTTVIAGRSGWFWKSRSLWRQALSVEFGTSHKSGKAVLRNSLDRHSAGMLETFKNTLGPAIEKKAKALHKKRLKGR